MFDEQFHALTGFRPMRWQHRLHADYFAKGVLPSAVDIPTGLGKTAVIALWLIALQAGAKLPRRLIYVVDRRAVVDQATAFVERLRERLVSDEYLPVSTLRGQHADNREWLDDPSLPAIIVGTVDMIGSRLLFEGYGISRKMRPYQAGLLGADTLVMLDEAHLVPPFERLLESIEIGPGHFGPVDEADRELIPQLHLLSLSATGRQRPGEVFRLEERDIEGETEGAKVTRKRLQAPKSLRIIEHNGTDKELPEKLARVVWEELAQNGNRAGRFLVFCNSRDHAERVAQLLGKQIRGFRKERKNDGHALDIADPELFIGARRVYERQAAERKLAELGFLADSDRDDPRVRFLVATSAGEVGVDLDADHMACDLVAWERMVQRLGRVNRRGDGQAQIAVIDAGPGISKLVERAHRQVRTLLETLPPSSEQTVDVSPEAIRTLRCRADEELKEAIADASTPPPLCPALTRPLLDAWSMTTLKTHTGRPEVAPWLRGWVDQDPQTTVVWRAHFPVPSHVPEDSLSRRRWHKAAEDYFEAAPPHITEKLETESYRVAEWLLARTKTLRKSIAAGDKPGMDVPTDEMPIAFLLTSASDYDTHHTLQSIEKLNKNRLQRELAGKTLIVHRSLGGLSPGGTLDQKSDQPPDWLGDHDQDWSEAERSTDRRTIKWSVIRLNGTQTHEPESHWHKRYEFVIKQNEDGEAVSRLEIYKLRQDAANEEDRSVGPDQGLSEHQSCAADHARKIGERLNLPGHWTKLLVLAARLHDEGKRAERWQNAFNAPSDGRPYAKTQGPVNLQLLDGYRHEFGSLFHAERDPEFQALSDEDKDLVLHLIAAHHGNARPTIATRGCDEAPPSALKTRAQEVTLRFARLQRRWGPWSLAWWEALLRAADQKASKDNEKGATP